MSDEETAQVEPWLELPEPRTRDIVGAALLALLQALVFVACLVLTVQRFGWVLKAWHTFKFDLKRWSG